MAGEDSRETLRFRDFVLDVSAYELRRAGRPVRLERQPMDLLILLVERRGQLVSRSQIVEALWGQDVFVDVETGVHTAIRKIRQALRDSPSAPSFVETVPGKGYRFVAPVEVVPNGASRASGPTVVAPATDPAADALPDATVPPTAAMGAGPADSAVEPTPAADPGAIPRPDAVPARRTRSRRLVAVLAIGVLAGVLVWGWTRPVSPARPVTIAVLPFENLSGDPERDYLADGLAEDTIASLGRIDPQRVSVIGRTSMMAYKGTTKSLAEIGRELGADYLVESSLRAERDHLRITARLVRARDQVQVWSDSFDRNATSILRIQQELSSAIADQVRTSLSPSGAQALARREPLAAEAYDLFLRGRHFANQRTPESMRRAITAYTGALALDPDYALAWADLTIAYGSSAINSDADPMDVWPRAREAAVRAVAANRDLAEAQQALGHVNWWFEWNWPVAEAAFRRAIDLDPSYSFAHLVLGHLLSQSGRHDEAHSTLRRARELDPLNPMSYALSAQASFQARDYAAALEHANRSIALRNEFWIAYQMRGQAREQLGLDELALQDLATAARFSGENSKPLSLTAYILARSGRTSEARDLLATLEAASGQRYVPPYALALVHAGLGEDEAVFEWLDRAYSAHDIHLIFLTVDPKWDPYRADPRFTALLARCGFATGGQPERPTRP